MPPQPRVFLLCGPSLAGKSTLAERLARLAPAKVLSADAINAERGLPFGGEGLSESVWAETLRRQIERFHAEVVRGCSVVVDDTLCYRWLRDRWRSEAARAGVKHVLLLCRPTTEELLARHAVAARAARRPVLPIARLREHLATFEWPGPDEAAMPASATDDVATCLRALGLDD